ncbi:ABC transporter permease [Desulfolithobacter sp.]
MNLPAPVNGCLAVYRREMLILRRRFKRQLAGQAVSPLLYLLTFGYAMGGELRFDGITYLQFLLPGLVAMSSMTQSFSIATDINVARFYWHIFDEFQAAPLANGSYVAGEVLAGMTRALISTVIILVLGLLFGVLLHYGPLFWLAILLNSFLFASLAVALAMLVKNHADQSLLTSFVITPMAFLGGTFFPLDRLPHWVQVPLSMLPLSHASAAIRSAALGRAVELSSLALLAMTGAVIFWLALHCVNRARD